MQVTVRSYLLAGITAAAATAIAIAPLPSVTPPDVTVPTLTTPVDLAATPSAIDLFTLGITDTAAVASGALQSGSNAAGFGAGDTQFFGASFAALTNLVASDPETYLPLAAVSVAALPATLTDLGEQQTTGVIASGQNPLTGAYTLPGQADSTAFQPITTFPGIAVKPTVAAPINAAAVKVATDFDNVSAAIGGPKLAKPVTTSAQAVGTSFIQAQGLVRSAAAGAVQGTATAALTGNPQAVSTAIQTGASNIQKSIVGDPNVPLVNPATGKPSNNPALNTAAPVKRLGAIGTVSSTVQKAANDIGNAVTGNN